MPNSVQELSTAKVRRLNQIKFGKWIKYSKKIKFEKPCRLCDFSTATDSDGEFYMCRIKCINNLYVFQNGGQKFIEIEIRTVLYLINLEFLEFSSTVGWRINALPLQTPYLNRLEFGTCEVRRVDWALVSNFLTHSSILQN